MKWKSRAAKLLILTMVTGSMWMPMGGSRTAYGAPEPEVLFQQDFQAGTSQGLTLIGASNSWSVAPDPADPDNRVLVQNTGGTEAFALAGNASWTDYTAEVRVKMTKDGPYPGLIFRYANAQNYYMFRIDPNNKVVELTKKSANTDSLLGRTAFSSGLGTWYHLKIAVNGTSIRCYLNGDRLFDVTDASLASGQTGLRTKWGSIAADDMKVGSLAAGLPSAPSGLAAEGGIAPTTVPLVWETVPDAALYRLYRSASESGGYQQIYRGADNRFTDTGLTPSTPYYYKVSAEARGIESPDSPALSVSTTIEPPAAPEGFGQVQPRYARTVRLGWTAAPMAARYAVYRADKAEGPYAKLGETEASAYTDQGLTPGSAYYYKVTAKNAAGESPAAGPAEAFTSDQAPGGLTEEQLKANDYILYFVNAGDPTPETVEAGDRFGLYASLTEQGYQADPATGRKWGLETAASATHVSDAADKLGTLRYYNGAQTRDKAIKYKFELPEEGYYDISFGFKNPWSSRKVNLLAEGSSLTNGDYAIGMSDYVREETFGRVYVYDGELNVAVQGSAADSPNSGNDPLVSYIIVRKNVFVSLSDLESRVAAAKEKAAGPGHSAASREALNTAVHEAEQLLAALRSGEKDDVSAQQELWAKARRLAEAESRLGPAPVYDSFTPGKVWTDTDGALIQAHGGGILYDNRTARYYWYGEDKTNGYLPARGVRVYSSADLYNWKDEGLALTAIESLEQFDTDPLISRLYAGRTDRADILNDIGTNRIIERPKVIYNDKTGKYVMWMHTDGPSLTSNANYAKAEAGYALSDSPTGPFVYYESNRMDRVPPGATDDYQPNQPGMARDMTLFKDEDGTAYLVYSSEENRTMYISRLTEDYTDVTGWHKDGRVDANGKPLRDASYKAVYGVDYIRLYPGAQREAPAMFKYKGKYYMLSSGATGWDPNPARYTVADSIFGTWAPLKDPSVGANASTTFKSQSTHVIPVDPAAGKFIYMGDRWVSADLKQSRYIWLPIEFGPNDEVILRWYDEWSLNDLDSMGSITVNTALPAIVKPGEPPLLPDKLNITKANGVTVDTPVIWNADAAAFAKPGTVTVTGELPQIARKQVVREIHVLPEDVIYLVHAGGTATPDYKIWASHMQDTLLNRETIDQAYNPSAGRTWGYVGDGTNTAGDESGNMFTSLRYLLANKGDDLTYRFDLDNGRYGVYVGLHDKWHMYTNGSRKADILINGAERTSDYTFTAAYDTLSYPGIQVRDGKLEVTVRRGVPSSPDPQISWIMIVDEAYKERPAARLTGPETVLHGQPFELTYGIANVTSSVYAKEVTVHYDPQKLQYNGAVSVRPGFQVVGAAEQPGSVRILEAAAGVSGAVYGTADLLKLRFTALPSERTVSTSVYVSDVRIADREGTEQALLNGPRLQLTVSVPEVPPVDRTALAGRIAAAEALKAAARVDAIKWGHYPQAAMDVLTAAIGAARTVYEDVHAVQEQIDRAAADLAQAVSEFEGRRNRTAHIGDLAVIAANYGTDASSVKWAEISVYDVNADGRLDLADLTAIAKRILQQGE